MAESSNCTVYVGNLHERVSDRVLYDILVQAGRIVDLYIPRDKENDKPKGFAFAKYETEQIANYAVKLFSGSVTLYSKTLKFAISGQNKPSNSSPMATPRPRPVAYNQKEISPKYMRLSTFCSENEQLDGPILTQLPVDDVFTRDLPRDVDAIFEPFEGARYQTTFRSANSGGAWNRSSRKTKEPIIG
uniref:RNA-binding protein 7-like n=1 Tax=Nicotiana tabacum TaxID=4097 RepID=A0A1S3YK91_TOBAC|nr:PREDICTED: RNA-binding protein 7-like [Nicotiana tabacum]